MHTTTNFIEPKIFRMFMVIKSGITSPRPINEMSEHGLVELLADQIKNRSDEVALPLFRIDNKFWIYPDGDDKVPVPNRSIEKLVLFVGEHLGISKEILGSIPFRNQVFGRLWRILKPDD